ncbi:MAG: HAD hydrolase family protein [Planctomycetes bacterium]|nr:HAD hydrolase family protein [Planctomycetota bacterium]
MTQKIAEIMNYPEKVSAIKLLVLDIDGVMTDGTIIYSSSGDDVKIFDAKDGAGMKYWARAGHAAAIITGRTSTTIPRRAKELDIAQVEMDAKNKLPVFEKVLKIAGVTAEETAVVGDDLPDLPLITRAGIGIAVADAVSDVKERAPFVTVHNGGHGAVREVVESLLRAQGRWNDILARYIS